MPYDIFKRADEVCVYKVNSDKKPVGKPLGCHPTAEKALKQIMAIESSEELAHYGTKGMRWGVRKDKKGRTQSQDYKQSRSLLRKRVSELSNEDLKKLNSRLQLERTLSSLDPTVSASGKRAVGKFMQKYGKAFIGGLAGAAATASVGVIVRKVSGG